MSSDPIDNAMDDIWKAHWGNVGDPLSGPLPYPPELRGHLRDILTEFWNTAYERGYESGKSDERLEVSRDTAMESELDRSMSVIQEMAQLHDWRRIREEVSKIADHARNLGYVSGRAENENKHS